MNKLSPLSSIVDSSMFDSLKENPTPTGPGHGPMRTDKESRRVGETVEFRNRRVRMRAKAKAARAARKKARS